MREYGQIKEEVFGSERYHPELEERDTDRYLDGLGSS
jgi:hypothetical protein